jgi:hypothetical protein
MVTLNAHFDGKAIIPDEPSALALEPGTRLKVIVEPVDAQPAAPPKRDRKAGSAKGQVWMSPDFDEPLDEFAEYMK